MKRSNLKNIVSKSGKIEDKKHKIQRNLVTKPNKELNKAYFKEKLPKGKDVKDFWNFCKPYFTNNGVCNDEKLILVEKEQVLRKDSNVSLKINGFNKYPSIKTIKEKFRNSFNCKFEFVSTDMRCVNETEIKKSSSGEISPAIIKLAKKEILIPITNCIDKVERSRCHTSV